MEQKTILQEILNNVEDYVNTQKRILKLQAIEKISLALSSLTSNIIVMIIFVLVFLFANIALALLATDYFGKGYLGFGAVAVLYLIIGLLLNIKKQKWLITPIADSIVKNLLKND
jgi:hypothetical protein